MRVKIRAAHPDDAKAISRLIREELNTPVSAADSAQKLSQLCVSPRHRIYAAEVDGAVVGYLHICDYHSLLCDPMKQIVSMAVNASYRRVGIGKALLARAEHWARDNGAAGIYTDAYVFSQEARDFLKSCGYEDELFRKYFE